MNQVTVLFSNCAQSCGLNQAYKSFFNVNHSEPMYTYLQSLITQQQSESYFEEFTEAS